MRMTALQGASLSKVANDSYLAEPFTQRGLVSLKTVLKLSGLLGFIVLTLWVASATSSAGTILVLVR